MGRVWSATFDATLENEDTVQDFLAESLKAVNCPRKTALVFRLVLEELFVNVARYAYAPQTGTVDVSLALDGDGQGATLELSDAGVAFDPFSRELPDEPDSVEDLSIGGRGILMVERYADEYTYERQDERNVVRVHKRFDVPAPSASKEQER